MMSKASGSLRLQAGGTLGLDALYVPRPADRELPAALYSGRFCYVLGARQMGKSSLLVRTAAKLRNQGRRCATIDWSCLVGLTPEKLYWSLIWELQHGLGLPDELREYWQSLPMEFPELRWKLFLEQVVSRLEEEVVIFIDELDAIRCPPSAAESFFGVMRAIYDGRGKGPPRVTFCLMGCGDPEELAPNLLRSPFPVSQEVLLRDFSADEATALLPGFQDSQQKSLELLNAVLDWTGGHPYMTMRVCGGLLEQHAHSAASPTERVTRLVSDLFFPDHWPREDPNLSYAERALQNNSRASAMIDLYERLLSGQRVKACRSDRVQSALQLTGMAAERHDEDGAYLQVRNRIFATAFDAAWAREQRSWLARD